MKCSLLALTRYLDHELDVNGSAEVDAHIVGCNRCTNALEQLKEDKAALGELSVVKVDRASLDGLLAHIGVDLAAETEEPQMDVDEVAAVAPIAVMEVPLPTEVLVPDLPSESQELGVAMPSWSGAGLHAVEKSAEEPEVVPQPTALEGASPPFLVERGPARAPELSLWQRISDWASLHVKGVGGEHGAIESVEIVKGNRSANYARLHEAGLDDGVDFPGVVEPPITRTKVAQASPTVEKPTKPAEVEKVAAVPVAWPEPPSAQVFPEIHALREELRDKQAPASKVAEVPEDAKPDRRLAIFGGVVLVLLVAGIATGTWVSNKSALSVSASASPAVSHSAAPSATPTATPQPTATPTPVPAGFTASQTVGNDGRGYQIQDIRYGSHTGDVCNQPSAGHCYRMVFDLTPAGSASGDPTAVVGYIHPSTMQVRILSTIPAGSAGSPANDVVTSVALVQPSPVKGAAVYNFTLSQTVSEVAYYLSSPERLVIDLTY